MAHPLVAVRQRRTHALDLHRLVPIVRRRNRAAVRSQTDQPRLILELFFRQLANVNLVPILAHVGESGVTDMAVVCPYDRL